MTEQIATFYGRLYGSLPIDALHLAYPGGSLPFRRLARLYLSVFGYPDVAGHLRSPIVLKFLQPQRGERILDAGCGTGIYTNTITAVYGASCVGIDLVRSRVDAAWAIARTLGLSAEFYSMCLPVLEFESASFDKAICIEVLEHVRDDRAALAELTRVLKPGGRLVLSVPRKEDNLSPEEIQAFEQAPLGGHVRSGYTFDELTRLFHDVGFMIEKHDLCYRLWGRIAIKAQQFMYQRGWIMVNIMTFPILNAIGKLDRYITGESTWYRGYVVAARKGLN